MEYRAYENAIPGCSPGYRDFATRKSVYMTVHFAGCEYIEDNTMLKRVWRKLQDRHDLPQEMEFVTNLPCPCVVCYKSPEACANAIFGPWLENARKRLLERNVLLAELAWVMVFLTENLQLPDSDRLLFRWGCESYQLLGGNHVTGRASNLLELAEDFFGVASAPYMALHRGLRYWGLREEHWTARQEYLDQLDQELGLLHEKRCELRQWLLECEVTEEWLRVSSIHRLNALLFAYPAIYDNIAGLVAMVALVTGTHVTRFLTEEQPFLSYKASLDQFGWMKRVLVQIEEAVASLRDDVETLRGTLPFAESTDPVAVQIRYDPRVEVIRSMDIKVRQLVDDVKAFVEDVAWVEATPYHQKTPPRAERYSAVRNMAVM
ncbi:uncharacterized protein PG998_009055 [Apiospora kogelbergensis]|uniref:uncharacterized protein n=1 Tax=Apiospora kogelbergensis TaxID=1337665 RepID=UPI00312EA2B1